MNSPTESEQSPDGGPSGPRLRCPCCAAPIRDGRHDGDRRSFECIVGRSRFTDRLHWFIPERGQCTEEGEAQANHSRLDQHIHLMSERVMSATVGEVHRLNASILAKVKSLFYRQYRAALLDYLLGSGEAGRARAYELGRWAVDSNLGLLHVLLVHQQAVNSILEATGKSGEGLRQLKASQEFLMETLSPLEMACRGYVELISHTSHDKRHHRGGR